MATPDQIYSALTLADAAGNVADARALARAYLEATGNHSTADELARWIVANADKKGSPDFEIVARAYKAAKVAEGYKTMDAAQVENQTVTALSAPSAPTHNAVTQYMLDGGGGSATFGAIFVTLLGALAAALVYRLVRGSWRSSSDTRQRKWMAFALVIPISAGVSRLANAALWSDSRDLELALAYFLVWAPLFAGGAYLLAKYLKNGPRNAPQADVPTPSAVNNNPLTSTPAPSTPAYIPSNTDPYQQAGQEILSGNVDPAIWARSLVEGAGNESAVKAAYVKQRVAQLNAAKGDV